MSGSGSAPRKVDMAQIFEGAGKAVAGLDIGTNSIELVVLSERAGGRSTVHHVAVRDVDGGTEPGVVGEAALRAIREMLRESRVRPRVVHVGLPPALVRLQRLTAPKMPEEELRSGAIRWRLRKDISLEHAVADFQVLGPAPEAQGRNTLDLLVAAADEQAVTQCLLALEALGLVPASVGVTTAALGQLVAGGTPLAADEAVAVVDIAGGRTTIGMFSQRGLEFVRELPAGGQHLSEALTQAVLSGQGQVQLSPTAADALKREVGIPGDGSEAPAGVALSPVQMLALMRPLLEQTAKEIRVSVDYYLAEHPGQRIERILLTGGGARLRRLDTFLQGKLNLPVARVELPTGVDLGRDAPHPPVLQELFPVVAGAFALALAKGRGLNLLPARFRQRRKKTVLAAAGRIAVISLLGVCALIYGVLRLQILHARQGVATVEAHWAMVAEIEALTTQLLERRQVFSRLTSDGPPVVHLMSGLSQVAPVPFVADELTVTRGRGETRGEFRVTGLIFETGAPIEESLAAFMQALGTVPGCGEVELVSRTKLESFNVPAAVVEVRCAVGSPPASAEPGEGS